MKKILFIEFCPISGSSNGLLTEIDFLGKQFPGVYECIVVSRPDSVFVVHKKRLGYTLYLREAIELKDFFVHPLSVFVSYISTLFFVFFIAVKHRPHIIHCNHYMWSIYANPVGFILHTRVLIHLKDVWRLEPKIARILMKFNPNVIYVAVSRYVRILFTKKYNIDKNKTIMIYDGIDDKIFFPPTNQQTRQKIRDSEKRIVMMSRVAPERDIEIFIDAAVLLLQKNPDLRFEHYGYRKGLVDEEYFSTLKQRVKGLGITKRIVFRQYIDEFAKVASVFRSSYLSVVPGRRFALPNAAIESMLCGTPVIALRVGGNPEIITNERMGALVSTCSPILFAQAIEQFLTGQKDYIEAVARGVKHAREAFSAEKQYKEIVRLYEYEKRYIGL